MGLKHLWDTNTVIYPLQKMFPPSAEAFVLNLLKTEQPALSSISEIELLSWRTVSARDVQAEQEFIDNAFILELEQPIKLLTAKLRKANRIKLPDAIIAATTLVYDLTLLTRNVSDFRNIQGLKLINPWDQ